MQAKVIRTFRDRHTGERHIAGSVIEVTKARYEEILTAGPFVKAVPEKAKPATPEQEAPAESAAEEDPKPAKRARKAKK